MHSIYDSIDRTALALLLMLAIAFAPFVTDAFYSIFGKHDDDDDPDGWT